MGQWAKKSNRGEAHPIVIGFQVILGGRFQKFPVYVGTPGKPVVLEAYLLSVRVNLDRGIGQPR